MNTDPLKISTTVCCLEILSGSTYERPEGMKSAQHTPHSSAVVFFFPLQNDEITAGNKYPHGLHHLMMVAKQKI